MTSPFLMPASSAGETLPFSVSTADVPATITPFALMRIPTASPPTARESARAAVPIETASTKAPKMPVILLKIKIFHPRFLVISMC